MKKIIILSGALCVLASAPANAQISVTLGAPAYYAPPVYVAPVYAAAPDWPSQHYDIHRHRHNDYWAARQQQERGHSEHDDDHGHG